MMQLLCLERYRYSVFTLLLIFAIIVMLKLQRSSFAIAGNKSQVLFDNKRQVCKKPNLDLSHDSVKYAFFPLKALNCTGTKLFYKDNYAFRLNETVLRGRKVDKCLYFGISRLNDKRYINTEVPYVTEKGPSDLIFEQDFIHVKCYLKDSEKPSLTKLTAVKLEHLEVNKETNFNKNITSVANNMSLSKTVDASKDGDGHSYEQLLAQIYPKSSVFDRISQRLHRRRNQPYMNVLMIGIDSMSHLSFQRKLPLTYKYIQQTLKSVILDGYNIVGDATTAAIIPMLTGKFETELPEVRRNQHKSHDVDVYPLIWKDFQELGYATMFAEDEPNIAVFNLRLNGFKDQPTDDYMRPFWQALWESESRRSSTRYCTGYKPNHEYLLDYLKDFYHQYNNVSKFAFLFGTELTHDDNNPGEYMDQDLTDLLVYLEENKHLENTLLIVMADHGARYSRVRKTTQGQMEERLPMMSLRFPKWFQEKYPKLIRNLYKNKNMLATPFDIHETLLDVLDLRRTELPVNQSQRSFSLLQSIPLNRTCASSDIQMHWCTCLKQVALEPSDKHLIKSAQSMINFINNRTAAVRDQCSLLAIERILNGQLLIPNEKVLRFEKSKGADQRVPDFRQKIKIDYAHVQVTIETGPNKGLYEAIIQVNMIAGSYTVIDDISRINMYGNQPICIQDKFPDLRKYCFCIKSSTEN